MELHISIARNGVRPVLPRRGLNPAALRVADAGPVLNPTQELPRRFPRGPHPAEAGAYRTRARPLKSIKTYGFS